MLFTRLFVCLFFSSIIWFGWRAVFKVESDNQNEEEEEKKDERQREREEF